MSEKAPSASNITHYAVEDAKSGRGYSFGEVEVVRKRDPRDRAKALHLGTAACAEAMSDQNMPSELSLLMGGVTGLNGGGELVAIPLAVALGSEKLAQEYLTERFYELPYRDLLGGLPQPILNIAIGAGADLGQRLKNEDGGAIRREIEESNAFDRLLPNDHKYKSLDPDVAVSILEAIARLSPKITPDKIRPLGLVANRILDPTYRPTIRGMNDENEVWATLGDEVKDYISKNSLKEALNHYIPPGFSEDELSGVSDKFDPVRRAERTGGMLAASAKSIAAAMEPGPEGGPPNSKLSMVLPPGVSAAEAIMLIDSNLKVRQALVLEIDRSITALLENGETATRYPIVHNNKGNKTINHGDRQFNAGSPREVVTAMALDMLSGRFDWDTHQEKATSMGDNQTTESGAYNGGQHSTLAGRVVADLISKAGV